MAAIRAYLDQDHRDWDLYLPEIECALRTSVHSATGVTPYFALFGQEMFTSGSDYKLARKLTSLSEGELAIVNREDYLQTIRERIKANLHNAFEQSAQHYDRRKRMVNFRPGQEVFRKNHVLSDFKNNINAKFCPKYVKCRIVKPIGNNMFEIENLQGKSLGACHVKDLKQ